MSRLRTICLVGAATVAILVAIVIVSTILPILLALSAVMTALGFVVWLGWYLWANRQLGTRR